jgi:acetyl esterase
VLDRLEYDLGLDPRIKALLSLMPDNAEFDVANREEMLIEASSPAGLERDAGRARLMEWGGNEEVAPLVGLRFSTQEIVSSPDGNTIPVQLIRPDGYETLACVHYIHGGGMAYLSSFYANFRAWARMIAANGVAVALVEFRNAVFPSAVPEVAPYSAGLNDCLSGLKWLHANAESLGIDSTRIVVAGESGGANLAIACLLALKRKGELELVKGLYALCPCLAGMWSDGTYPSSIENNGLFINVQNNRHAMGYGIEAYQARDPLAWARFATKQDVTGLPPTVISVDECDPLRDEGIVFFRLLLSAGVAARGREVLGTMHFTELLPVLCPEISRDTAHDLADFTKS